MSTKHDFCLYAESFISQIVKFCSTRKSDTCSQLLSVSGKFPCAKGVFHQGFRTKFAHSMKIADQE